MKLRNIFHPSKIIIPKINGYEKVLPLRTIRQILAIDRQQFRYRLSRDKIQPFSMVFSKEFVIYSQSDLGGMRKKDVYVNISTIKNAVISKPH